MVDTEFSGHNLSDARLIRQCREWQTTKGLPSFKAFEFRGNESYLSFNWLEQICIEADVPIGYDEAIIELEKRPPLEPERGYMWAILSCDEIRSSVKKVVEDSVIIRKKPSPSNPSHVGVWGWKHHDKRIRRKIARNLASRMTKSNTRSWPLTPPSPAPFSPSSA